MTDEKYQKLEEKYKKKCIRVSDLLKNIVRMEGEYKFIDERRDYWRNRANAAEDKSLLLEEVFPKNYYKIYFKAESENNGIIESWEIFFCAHPRIAVLGIEAKKYVNFKLISIEKMG